MSTPEPENETTTTADSGGPVVTDPPIDPETQPDPEPDPTPPPPTGDVITWEAATWYSITYACRTVGCPNENVVYSAPMFYSNDGQAKNIRVFDNECRKDSVILTATKLDPQPVEE